MKVMGMVKSDQPAVTISQPRQNAANIPVMYIPEKTEVCGMNEFPKLLEVMLQVYPNRLLAFLIDKARRFVVLPLADMLY